MADDKVYKSTKSLAARFRRLLISSIDPRALIHAFKIINYYNYSHVAELRQATLGQNLAISPNVSLVNARNLVIGDRVRIGARVSLWAGPGKGRIVLAEDVMIGPGAMLTAANYRYNDGSPVTKQAMNEGDIIVGRDVWIGANAIILPGVTIGDRAIIGAGAVVRRDVPPNGIVAGNPGVVVASRRPEGPQAVAGFATGAANPAVTALILHELPGVDAATLGLPLDDSGVDSFDLITLRTAVEAATGQTIPDQDWGAIATLGDIARLPALAASGTAPASPASPVAPVIPVIPVIPVPPLQAPPAFIPPAPPQTGQNRALNTPGRAIRHSLINMPQMALSGLSEAWLFKELGDLHWQMITDFLQSPSSAISDDTGDRLYATFTRILLEVEPSLRGFRENDPLTIDAQLDRYGASIFFGTHTASTATATARAQTMSTFAKYGERGANTSLIKGSPTLPQPDAIPPLAQIPEFGRDYRARRALSAGDSLFECDYDILAPHDINGVGLLYFAAYPLIFDLCIARNEAKGFLLEHSTMRKDICYYANTEPAETLVFRLQAREAPADGVIRHLATLSRKSDGVRIAEVDSIKRRV